MTELNCYHLCFVVSDLDATANELAGVLGVRWAPVQERVVSTVTGHAEQEFKMRVTFSQARTGPCLIELIEGPEGSIWYPGDGVRWAFHHLGFWSGDLLADSQRAVDSGYPVEATLAGDNKLNLFAYHQLANGPRIELVDAARKPSWQAWLKSEE